MGTQREEAVIAIGVDHSRVERGLKTVGDQVSHFGHRVAEVFTGIGASLAAAFTAEGLKSGFESLTRYVKDIKRVSESTGLNSGLVQDITNLAKASGVAGEAVEVMLDRFAKGLAPGANPEEALLEIADRLAGIEDPGERARIAVENFGKSGVKLIPILAKGSAGLRDMADGFQQISEEEIELIEKMDRRLEQFGTNLKATGAKALEVASIIASALKEAILHPLEGETFKAEVFKRFAEKVSKNIHEMAKPNTSAADAQHLKDLKEAAETQDFFAKIELHKAIEADKAREALEKKREAALEKHLKNLRTIWFSNQIGGATGDPKKQVAHNHDAELNAILGEEAARDMNLRSGNTIFAARRQRDIDAAKSRLAGTMSKELQVQNTKSPRDQLIDELMKRIGATVGKKGAIVVEVMDDDQ